VIVLGHTIGTPSADTPALPLGKRYRGDGVSQGERNLLPEDLPLALRRPRRDVKPPDRYDPSPAMLHICLSSRSACGCEGPDVPLDSNLPIFYEDLEEQIAGDEGAKGFALVSAAGAPTSAAGSSSQAGAEQSTRDPETLREALESPEAARWKEGMDLEMGELLGQNTWVLEVPPPGQHLISAKWVLRRKFNPDGSVAKYKARLVARGFTQREGADYGATYAPVSSYTTTRTFLVMTAAHRYFLWSADVTGAFLHGILDRPLWMQQPPQYHDGSRKACRLVKSIYGLKQSPRLWNKALGAVLEQGGFRPAEADPALYVLRVDAFVVVIPIWVDDLLMSSNSEVMLQKCFDLLAAHFKIRRVEPDVYLAMNIRYTQSTGELLLTQHSYIHKLAEKLPTDFPPSHCHTPIITDWHRRTKSPCTDSDELFRTKLGSLNFSAFSVRLDLALACSRLAQGNAHPALIHKHEINRTLQYLYLTPYWGIRIQTSPDELDLTCYTDSDDGADNARNRPTSGYVTTLGGMPISWKSSLQKSPTMSTCESELVASALAGKQVLWLRRLVNDLQIPPIRPCSMFTDNNALVQVLKGDGGYQGNLRHVKRRHFWVQHQVEEGELTVDHVRTESNPADIFTKPLGFNVLKAHQEFLHFINLPVDERVGKALFSGFELPRLQFKKAKDFEEIGWDDELEDEWDISESEEDLEGCESLW
jgi:hypothetical protein